MELINSNAGLILLTGSENHPFHENELRIVYLNDYVAHIKTELLFPAYSK